VIPRAIPRLVKSGYFSGFLGVTVYSIAATSMNNSSLKIQLAPLALCHQKWLQVTHLKEKLQKVMLPHPVKR
jgi:hypothetical protein